MENSMLKIAKLCLVCIVVWNCNEQNYEVDRPDRKKLCFATVLLIIHGHETFYSFHVKQSKNGDFLPIYFFTFGSVSSDLRPTPLSNQQIWSLWALIVHVQKVWFEDAWELTFQRLAKSAAPKDLLSKICLSWFFEKKLFMFWLFSPTFY